MIITQIIGGLGNQMFQYAMGRGLALKNNNSLKVDISGFESYGLHQGFELQRVFSLQCEIASQADIRNILGWQYLAINRRILSLSIFSSVLQKRWCAEPHFHYWAGINNVSANVYLSGYWQSERYFLDEQEQIRTDFTFCKPLLSENLGLARQIQQVSAVSLHVRRGDYVSNPNAAATHGLCSLDYYQNAIKYITERVTDPHFFIFSDDIEWAKEHIKIAYPCEFVGHNQGLESYNDMRLMSMCQHHIIANSSFSWWGAWLNPNADKIVVSPKQWFANSTNTEDLIPTNWVRL
ncbi:MAG: alpha-1,2-fucosyltransferase [Sideroxydans sp.]|nr:alpha-1,2-fucosyltransferase [Sideroxydans sp.]